MASESRIAVLAAFFGNLIIAIGKLTAGLAAGSAAMLAEAAHSFSDVGNQVLLLLGISRSKRPPSKKYPFGTGKAAYFWPFMVAVLLFGVAGTYSLIHGYEKFTHPHAVGDIRLSLAILTAAFIIEAVVLFIAVKQARKLAKEAGLTARQWLQENRDASLLTILVEDTLALVGLPIAGIALWLSSVTGDGRYDGAGSMIIGALLMGFALYLGSTVRGLLIGMGLGKPDLAKIHAVLEKEPAVKGIRSLRTLSLGPQSALLAAELALTPGMDSTQAGQVLGRLEARFKEAVPQLQYVYLEDHE